MEKKRLMELAGLSPAAIINESKQLRESDQDLLETLIHQYTKAWNIHGVSPGDEKVNEAVYALVNTNLSSLTEQECQFAQLIFEYQEQI